MALGRTARSAPYVEKVVEKGMDFVERRKLRKTWSCHEVTLLDGPDETGLAKIVLAISESFRL